MIALTTPQHDLLRAVIDAGDEGLAFPQGDARFGLGDALGLAIDGLITAQREAQRLHATAKGKAFAQRDTYA